MCVCASSCGSTSLSARSMSPADSKRLTSRCGCEPTSQNLVGIGVPSKSSGSFFTTTGSPVLSRTTTSKSPCGRRPSSSVTRAMSWSDALSITSHEYFQRLHEDVRGQKWCQHLEQSQDTGSLQLDLGVT